MWWWGWLPLWESLAPGLLQDWSKWIAWWQRWGKEVLQGQGREEHLTPCLGKKPDLVLFVHVTVIFSSRIFKWRFFIVSFLCRIVICIFGQCILSCFILLKHIFIIFHLLFWGREICVKETSISCLLATPWPGIEPETFWCSYFSSFSNCPHQVGMNELIYHSPKWQAVLHWLFKFNYFVFHR